MLLRHFFVIALISTAAFMSVLHAREPEPAMSASVASPGAWLRVQGDGRYSAGQPTVEQLQALPAHGIAVVIDLRADTETPDLDEATVVRSLGLDYHNLPVRGAAGLTRDNVLALDRLIADAGDRPLLVHCASSNRVGAMMALREHWLRGATPEQALAIGRDWGMKGLESDVDALLQDGQPGAQSSILTQAPAASSAPAIRTEHSD
ncbi:MAG: protein tyrosine phosphatase family protein [Lysobacteraceae bacterium]